MPTQTVRHRKTIKCTIRNSCTHTKYRRFDDGLRSVIWPIAQEVCTVLKLRDCNKDSFHLQTLHTYCVLFTCQTYTLLYHLFFGLQSFRSCFTKTLLSIVRIAKNALIFEAKLPLKAEKICILPGFKNSIKLTCVRIHRGCSVLLRIWFEILERAALEMVLAVH